MLPYFNKFCLVCFGVFLWHCLNGTPGTLQLLTGFFLLYSKKTFIAWMDKNKPCQTLYTEKQSSLKSNVLPCYTPWPYFHITNGSCPSSENTTAHRKMFFFFLSLTSNSPHLKRSFCLCFQVPLTIINGPELTKEMHQQILLFPLLGKSILRHILQSLKNSHFHQQVVYKRQKKCN